MRHDAIVTKKLQESTDTWTIFFTIDGGVLPFTAGQYITIYFEETGWKKGKAYSLSSTPWDTEMSITVKKIGDFSALACALEAGDRFKISNPYGFFNAQDDAPIVAIAAGVGISPIWSILRDELKKNNSREIYFLQTAPTAEHLIKKTEVEHLFSNASAAECTFFVTREKATGAHNRRLVVGEDVPSQLFHSGIFYVCGSDDFVRAMWLQLMESGVDERRVVTETFFESAP